MKRKRTPEKMQNIATFFNKKSATINPPPPTHPTPQIQPPTLSNEPNSNPHQVSEQHSSPTHDSPLNSAHDSPHNSPHNSPQNQQDQTNHPQTSLCGERLSESELANLPQDPGLRRKMKDFHKDDRDLVRRIYLQRKPCQPKECVFPQTFIGGKKRRFNVDWFETWSEWLEYSVSKDAAFCFICCLFKDENTPGGDAFVSGGFKSWNRLETIRNHVGKHMSAHSNAVLAMDLFKKQSSSIISALSRQSIETKNAYRKRLEASVETVRELLAQGLSFRGHDEKETSLNRGNFLWLLSLLSKHDEEYKKVVFHEAPGNCQLTSPPIQKDIINACAKETTKAILEDLDGSFFAILADESADVSDKEQIAICLRYVNKKGLVCERLLGIVHVGNTTSSTLKLAIESLLMEYSLSFSQVRGQGYDGASNMQGSINGLKTLIQQECPQAYFVHCFAHQLQLTQVALAKKNRDCAWLFTEVLSPLLNFVGGSPKRREFLREKQAQRVVDALSLGELESGSGLNQERGLGRPCDTRWGSHHKTIANVLLLYPSILLSLDDIVQVSDAVDSNKAETIAGFMMSFDFVFLAHLMGSILAITNELNVALQRHDQDIVNAMLTVDITKENLQKLRDEGWDGLLKRVTSFMVANELEIPDMNERYVFPVRKSVRGKNSQVSNFHHFRVEVFVSVIDLQLQELNDRFPEISKELLMCMSGFNPANRFSSFDTEKLIKLATFYPNDFPDNEVFFFRHTLDNFICAVRKDDRFWNLKSLTELSMKLVETGLAVTHHRVYLLLRLVLTLPVATASVERVFSGMTHVKDKLRNSMGDQMLNDCLITYLEKDVFLEVSMDDIINRYQNMKTRREQL